MPASLKLLVATHLLTRNPRTIPKFWIQCETRTLVEKGKLERTWRAFVAGFPKTFVKGRYEFDRVYLPVFATTIKIDEENGLCRFDLTTLERDDVGVDFKPEAMVFNLAGAWWRLKFDEEGLTDWGSVPYIDGQLCERFKSTYTFEV